MKKEEECIHRFIHLETIVCKNYWDDGTIRKDIVFSIQQCEKCREIKKCKI